jgi:hypothetical protein
LKKNILGVKNRFFDKNALFFIEILHGQISTARRHFAAKFYGEQLCRTSLFRENSSKRSKIDFLLKIRFTLNSQKIDHNFFFLHSQISTARRHFIAKFYGEQLCRTSLFRENSSKYSKIDFLAKNPLYIEFA